MDLVSVVTSQMSDSRSNELEASSSSQVTDYDSRVDTPITVEQYPGLCDSRPNKLISSASAASESGYNSYCNHSCISTDEAHSTTHRTYCNFDKTEAQFCINTLQSSENLSNRACQNLQCAHATNSEGSKLNQNDNNSFSNVLAAAIGHNYAPKDFSTFASNLCCQSNIMSTPDTENRNTNQGCFKSNHDVLWTGKVSDQCNDLSITSSEDSNHNNDSLQTEVHNYVKNENGSCCSFSPLLPSHTCHYNYHHDREEKSKMAFFSNLPEVAYNLVNTHSQTYGTEALDCVNFQQSVGDNSTSTQEDSSEGDCKSSKGSFVYIQKPSVNWPQVDRFYEIKPRLDHTPELNSKMSMHIDYTNPAHYSSDFGIQCSPQEHLMNGPNILPSNEVSSYNSKPSKVNLHKVKNMSALLSAAQMSGNCPSSSILTSNISKFFLINSTTGVSLQPQSTEDHAKTKGDEHNYHSAVVPWHLQIQFSSDQGLARENASYSDYNPRSHQTDNTNVTQGGFCTHANTPSTYFDFSSLHSERKDGSLDGSVSGKAVLATEKIQVDRGLGKQVNRPDVLLA
ncbi:unnamed protein product [Heterobilharzia americana]|nr:unnamed protein product [Heterobilharzia americana]